MDNSEGAKCSQQAVDAPRVLEVYQTRLSRLLERLDRMDSSLQTLAQSSDADGNGGENSNAIKLLLVKRKDIDEIVDKENEKENESEEVKKKLEVVIDDNKTETAAATAASGYQNDNDSTKSTDIDKLKISAKTDKTKPEETKKLEKLRTLFMPVSKAKAAVNEKVDKIRQKREEESTTLSLLLNKARANEALSQEEPRSSSLLPLFKAKATGNEKVDKVRQKREDESTTLSLLLNKARANETLSQEEPRSSSLLSKIKKENSNALSLPTKTKAYENFEKAQALVKEKRTAFDLLTKAKAEENIDSDMSKLKL